MATGKRYYWIKLKDSFMTSDAVDFLMSQPDGANYVVLYQILCLKTINTGGKLERHIGEIIIPYDEAKIQRDAKWFTIDTVRVALNLYKNLGLVYEEQDGSLAIANYGDLVGSETDWKRQKQEQREKKLPVLQECRRLNANTILLPSGKKQNVDEKRYGGNGMLVYDLAGGRCEMCGSYENLMIHHANGYSNDPEDLYVLCATCHGRAHSPATEEGWLHHTRIQTSTDCGQDGGHVHTDIRDKIIDNRDKRIDIEKKKEKKEKEETRVIPPTVEEVRAYCEERHNGIDPEAFIDFYATSKWKRGNTKITDWKACVRTWERRQKSTTKPQTGNIFAQIYEEEYG